MPEYRVEYTRKYKRVIEASDVKDAERRMRAFVGSLPEGEIKLIQIYELKPEITVEAPKS